MMVIIQDLLLWCAVLLNIQYRLVVAIDHVFNPSLTANRQWYIPMIVGYHIHYQTLVNQN